MNFSMDMIAQCTTTLCIRGTYLSMSQAAVHIKPIYATHHQTAADRSLTPLITLASVWYGIVSFQLKQTHTKILLPMYCRKKYPN